MKLSRIVAALAACIPGLCMADPVTIIAVGAQALAAGGVITAATAAWVGVGLAVYGMAKARQDQRKAAAQARAQQVASLQDRTFRPLTNLPPRETVYGLVRKAGHLVDSFASNLTATGADGVTRTYPDGLRHLVIAWAAHECDGIRGIAFDADTLQPWHVGADGWALPGSPFHRAETATRTHQAPAGTSVLAAPAVQILSVQAHSDWQPTGYTLAADQRTITVGKAATVTYTVTGGLSMLRVSHHLGADAQTVDAYLASIAPTRYTTAHRLAGVCYSVITVDLRFERWQSGPPNPIAEVRGKRLHDPRTGATAYSENVALMALDYLRHPSGWAVDLADINIPTIIAAANACDEFVLSAIDGITVSAPRYTGSGVWETGQSREAVLDDLCRAMAGTATYAGQWVITAGVYTAPVMSLTDTDLAGSISVVQAGAPDDQISNSVRCAYIPWGQLTVVDAEPYSNPALVTADGGELWDSLDLNWTGRNWIARNIARIHVETRRNGLVISYPAKMRAIELLPGDRVTVTSTEYGWASKVFRVTDAQLAPRQGVALTLQEDGPDAWDRVDASASDPTPNTGLPSPWGVVPPVTGLTATSGTGVLQVQSDGTIITRVRVSWDAVAWPYATGVELTWTPPGGTPTTVTAPGGQTSVDIIGPIDGQTITIGARVRTLAESSQWAYIAHTVVGKSEPPPPVETLALAELPDLGRTVSWTYPLPPPDLAGFVARYSAHTPVGTPWAAQADLFATSRDARTFSSTSAPPDGEWDITVRAIDTTGNLSTPVTVTVLLSQGALGTPLMTAEPHAMGWPGAKTDCVVEGAWLTQSAVPWSALPATWSAWTAWSTAPTSISYTHQINLGAPANVRIRADATSNAITTLDLQHSSNGTDWSAWEPIPVGHVNAHHLRVRATVTGAAQAYLYNMTISVYT